MSTSSTAPKSPDFWAPRYFMWVSADRACRPAGRLTPSGCGECGSTAPLSRKRKVPEAQSSGSAKRYPGSPGSPGSGCARFHIPRGTKPPYRCPGSRGAAIRDQAAPAPLSPRGTTARAGAPGSRFAACGTTTREVCASRRKRHRRGLIPDSRSAASGTTVRGFCASRKKWRQHGSSLA